MARGGRVEWGNEFFDSDTMKKLLKRECVLECVHGEQQPRLLWL